MATNLGIKITLQLFPSPSVHNVKNTVKYCRNNVRVRVVSRNINSMGDDRKTDSIYNYMYKNSADVFIFLDTRTGPEDTARLQKNGKACAFSTTSNPMQEA